MSLKTQTEVVQQIIDGNNFEELQAVKDVELKEYEVQIIYDYYKQQREELALLAKESSSVTLQLLVLSGGLTAVFFQTQLDFARVAIALGIIAIGVVSYTLNFNVDKSAKAYMQRARLARKHVKILEKFALSGVSLETCIIISFRLVYSLSL